VQGGLALSGTPEIHLKHPVGNLVGKLQDSPQRGLHLVTIPRQREQQKTVNFHRKQPIPSTKPAVKFRPNSLDFPIKHTRILRRPTLTTPLPNTNLSSVLQLLTQPIACIKTASSLTINS
jgi:hypothetical protein